MPLLAAAPADVPSSRDAIERVLLLVYVVLLPLRWSPFPANVQWSEIAFAALAVVFVARGGLRRVSWRRLDAFVLLYLAAMLPSFLATTDVLRSAVELSKRLYLGCVYVVASTLLVGSCGRLVEVLRWLAGTAAGWAVIGLAAAASGIFLGLPVPGIAFSQPLPYLGTTYRLNGPFLTAEYFGEFLAFCFPIALAIAWRRERSLTAWHAAAWLTATACVLTVSRSIGGLLLAAVVLFWSRWSSGWRRYARTTAAIACIAFLLALNAVSIVAVRRIALETGRDRSVGPAADWYTFHDARAGARAATASISYDFVSYFLLKKVALQSFLEQPWTGVGLDMFPGETERAYREGRIHVTYRASDPHSTIFGALAETGIPGAVGVAALWVAAFVIASWGLAGRDNGLARAVIAAVVGMLVSSINADVMNFRFLWVGFALIRTFDPDMSSSS